MEGASEFQVKLIANLKCHSFESAQIQKLTIVDENTAVVGYLLPIGEWVLKEPHIIANIAEWRGRDMKNFLIQFVSTFDRTQKYLLETAIQQPNRLFFLITDGRGNLMGHLGLSHVKPNFAELDNLMRGKSGGPNNLMELAEKTLIRFAQAVLGITTITLKVLSFNFLAIAIHQRLGFEIEESQALKKILVGEEVHHEVVPRSESNVNYKCLVMLRNLA